MTRNDRTFLLAVAGGLALLLASCDEGGSPETPAPKDPASPVRPAEPGQPVAPAAPAAAEPTSATWQLSLTRPAEVDGPRMAEVFVRHGAGLRFSSAATGLAASAAGKRVVAQERPGGLVRLLVFSGSNVARLDSGVLAELSFERAGDGPTDLEVLYERSAFAPAALHPRPETLQLSAAEEATP